MIIDFARYYPNVKSFTDLNGTHCSTCDTPFVITTVQDIDQHSNNDNISRISCTKCTLNIRFYVDAYRCSSIDMLDYGDFGFYYQPKSTTRPVDVISISALTKYTGWMPFSNNTSFLLTSEIAECIASGEADKICTPPPPVNAPIIFNLNI